MLVLPKKRHIVWIVALAVSVAALSCVPEDVIWVGFSASDRYLGCATSGGSLNVFDLEKRKGREITREAANGGFEWSPAGDRLAFCIRGKGGWNLALVDADGTITLLTRGEGRDLQPTWSPDGRGIYYVSSDGGGFHGDYDICYYDLASRQRFPIIRGPHDQVEPRISPDGRRLAAVSYQHGNPLILIYALKTTRVIQIAPPPAYRGGQLHLLCWLGDSRRLLYQVEQGGRYDLVECEVEGEKSEVRDSSAQPFESVTLDRSGRDLLYVTGGRAYRRATQPRWGRKHRLSLDDFTVGTIARRHNDDRLGVVAERTLVALASSSGDKLQPVLDREDESLGYYNWGMLELERGRKRASLGYFQAAVRSAREQDQKKSEKDVAPILMSCAIALLRHGYVRDASACLRQAQQLIEKSKDETAHDSLSILYAFHELIWKNRPEAAREWIAKIAPCRLSGELADKAALILRILDHPDKNVRRQCRRGIAALWRDQGDEGSRIFRQLLRAHRNDPAVQTVYQWSSEGLYEMFFGEGVAQETLDAKRKQTQARMTAGYYDIVGLPAAMDREALDKFEVALMMLRDVEGLKRVALKYDRQVLGPDQVRSAYGEYWRMADRGGTEDALLNDVIERFNFDPDVLARVVNMTTEPLVLTDVRLACARHALVSGDNDELKRGLGDLGKDLERLGADQVFGSDLRTSVTYSILQGEHAERVSDLAQAGRHYRGAANEIEKLIRAKSKEPDATKHIAGILHEVRFRADLFERGTAVHDELNDLLTIERGVGDHLMTDSTDPTSLLNSIHNYFGLLGHITTPWVRDIVYVRAGQSYRRLGRWCEAGFCLRVAAQSHEGFVARYARAELAELYHSLEDPGLAAWFSPN